MKLYGELASQPTRLIARLCKEENIHFELVVINILAKQNKTPEFLQLNPAGKIPVIDDDGFILTESHAIAEYLCKKHNCYEKWFGKTIQEQALVSQYLHWHHFNMRKVCGEFLFNALLAPLFGVQEVDTHKIVHSAQDLQSCFQRFNISLSEKQFIAGTERISVADLSAFCEVEQFCFLPQHSFDGKFPHIKRWQQDVENQLPLSYAPIHTRVLQVRDFIHNALDNLSQDAPDDKQDD